MNIQNMVDYYDYLQYQKRGNELVAKILFQQEQKKTYRERYLATEYENNIKLLQHQKDLQCRSQEEVIKIQKHKELLQLKRAKELQEENLRIQKYEENKALAKRLREEESARMSKLRMEEKERKRKERHEKFKSNPWYISGICRQFVKIFRTQGNSVNLNVSISRYGADPHTIYQWFCSKLTPEMKPEEIAIRWTIKKIDSLPDFDEFYYKNYGPAMKPIKIKQSKTVKIRENVLTTPLIVQPKNKAPKHIRIIKDDLFVDDLHYHKSIENEPINAEIIDPNELVEATVVDISKTMRNGKMHPLLKGQITEHQPNIFLPIKKRITNNNVIVIDN